MSTWSENEHHRGSILPFDFRQVEPTSGAYLANARWTAMDACGPETQPAEQRSSKDLDAAIARQRDEARSEGELQARAIFEEELRAIRTTVTKEIERFAAERDDYFARIEREVVRLAMCIARKVLHRESQLDPHLLQGLARVALDDISQATKVRLHVNPAELDSWREFFSSQVQSRSPEIIADRSIAQHGCSIRTDLGQTQISIDDKLDEIERGLFDLLASRPEPRAQVLQ